jgi:hypothetical protein
LKFTPRQTEFIIDRPAEPASGVSLASSPEEAKDDNLPKWNSTVAFLKSQHPEVQGRILKPSERSKKLRIYIISLLPYEVHLTAKNDDGHYVFMNSLQQFEELHLLTTLDTELAVFTARQPDKPEELLMLFQPESSRVSRTPFSLFYSFCYGKCIVATLYDW